MELEVRKIQELGKAELNAAISKEKSSHLEQMSEANLNVNSSLFFVSLHCISIISYFRN